MAFKPLVGFAFYATAYRQQLPDVYLSIITLKFKRELMHTKYSIWLQNYCRTQLVNQISLSF